jgi:Phosphoribulokinase / Uridine kinase family
VAFASKDLSLRRRLRKLCSDIGFRRKPKGSPQAARPSWGTENGYSRKAKSRTLPRALFLVGQAPHHRDHRLFGSRDKHRADDFRGDLPARRRGPGDRGGRCSDFINYICPQFSETQVNFQRVPIVDTSNPFTARHIPSQDESMLGIRFRDPRGVDFPYLLSMLKESFMSRANTIVCPGSQMPLAMQLIFTPMIWRLMERRRQA